MGWLSGSGKLSFGDRAFTQLLTGNSSSISTEGLDEILQVLRQNYDGEIDEQAFLEGMKRGAVASVGDTYTEYLSPEETKAFNEGLDGDV
jgi:C-terminal processing protease CtpA/Prc